MFFVHEEPLVVELFLALQEVQTSEKSNRWGWRHVRNGFFSTTPPYQVQSRLGPNSESHLISMIPTLLLIWESLTPSKVVVFS